MSYDPDPVIEYQHFYTARREPRLTVCYLRCQAHEVAPDGLTTIGLAYCGAHDQPSRARGRQIALGRAWKALEDWRANVEEIGAPGSPWGRAEAAILAQIDLLPEDRVSLASIRCKRFWRVGETFRLRRARWDGGRPDAS